jgi:hypothetical protein
MTIMSLPKRRGMKKSLEFLILLAAQTPMTVMPAK